MVAKKRASRANGFTLIEVVIVVVVIALLATVSVMGYNGVQSRGASAATQTDIRQAAEALQHYFLKNADYPPNLADVNYAATNTSTFTLYTNAPTTRVHQNLTPAQNAQLFLNSCNAQMPVMDGSTTYNTQCVFQAGKKLHIKGQRGSNRVITANPTIEASEINLTCGAACTTAQTNMINSFEAQGGVWPITIPSGQVTIPEPSTVTTGNASLFCLEARSTKYSDEVWHISETDANVPQAGECPDPEGRGLHYP